MSKPFRHLFYYSSIGDSLNEAANIRLYYDKNEEDVIAQCIDSISPYVEEVIVLDTGSIDKTVEIAKCKKVIVEQTS